MDKELSEALFKKHSKGLTDRLADVRGWVLHKVEYPTIDCEFTQAGRTSLRLLLSCEDWNEQPPSIKLLSSDGRELTATEVPVNTTGVFNPSLHPIVQRPFICMRGSREYHTHSSHVADLWEPIKSSESYWLGEIITQIWNAWRKG